MEPARDADDGVAHPEEHIFAPSAAAGAGRRVLAGHTLARAGLAASEVQRVLYFACPERVWLSRLPPHLRLLLKKDLGLLQEHLRYNTWPHPVSLVLGPPGAWAQHLPQLGLAEKERAQEHTCLVHRAEECALTVHGLLRFGANVRELRVVVDLREGLPAGAPAQGAAALVFACIARGGLEGLRHLTLLHAGSGGAAGRSLLAPLARENSVVLAKLQTLRLSLAEPRVPMRHLAWLAQHGRLPSIRSLALFGSTPAADADLAEVLRALLRPGHPLAELDLRGSLAGGALLGALAERLELGAAGRLRAVQLERTPAAGAEHAQLRGRVEELVQANGDAR